MKLSKRAALEVGLKKLLILAMAFCYSVAYAQTNATEDKETRRDIVEDIMASSGGNIKISIPDSLKLLLFQLPEVKKPEGPVLRQGVNKISGYRIQVFSDGRNQHSLEARAKARGNAIMARFPRYRGQVYTYSKSPNWYTRVGNFQSLDEATEALQELKRAFPSFSKEMRMVRCQITVIK